MSARRLPAVVAAELAAINPSRWRVEMPKRGHAKLFIDGCLVGVFTMSSKGATNRAELNLRAQVRRHLASRAAA